MKRCFMFVEQCGGFAWRRNCRVKRPHVLDLNAPGKNRSGGIHSLSRDDQMHQHARTRCVRVYPASPDGLSASCEPSPFSDSHQRRNLWAGTLEREMKGAGEGEGVLSTVCWDPRRAPFPCCTAPVPVQCTGPGETPSSPTEQNDRGLMEGPEKPKWALKDLNERLRGFVEHVHQLEQENRSLEEQVLEWGRRSVSPPEDWRSKEVLAQELRAQVSQMLMENTAVLLQSDAVKLRVSHLQSRCEAEEKFRCQKELQVSELKLKKDEVEMINSLLEKQLQQSRNDFQLILEEQEKALDQHHRQAVLECDRVLAQVAGENGRGMDLSWTSTQWERSSPSQSSPDSATPPNPAPGSGPASQTRPRRDASGPTVLLSPQVRAGDEVLKEARAELTEVRKQWHRLQVEIESLHALEKSLQSSLRHTQQQYSVQLRDLSRSVRSLESDLETVRDGLEVQRQNHRQLLNNKMRLEREIATYRKLLEHEEGRFFSSDGLKLKPWRGSVPAPEQNGLLNGCDEEIAQPVSTEKTPKNSPVLQRQKSLVILTDATGNTNGEICTVKTQEILAGNVVQESAEGHGKVETEKIDKVIRQWEGSFFQGNPKLRKKSVSLRFDLHMAVADEGCDQMKPDSLPNVEVRLVMRRSRSIPTFTQ